MPTSLAQLQNWMNAPEGEHLEFKEAKHNFHFEKLVTYCAALANEGGGLMILGVSDRPPRRVVGSMAFDPLERTRAGLIERLRLRVEVDEVRHPHGRVLVFRVPSRPIGMPIAIEGAYWMRGGQDLVAMTPDQIKRIFDESGPDFSAELCPGAVLDDLDPVAIEEFRQRWLRKSGNQVLVNLPIRQLLADAELTDKDRITYAALILLGTHPAIGRYLANAEVIFEYRSTQASGPASQRVEFRWGFLAWYDKLWETINLRNDLQHFQDGLFMLDVPTFSEAATREAILNAVGHRDYRNQGSVFIRQYPRRLEIVSPGGFPPGISVENIIDRQSPRNRRLVDSFARCGLVERAGQGLNRIFEETIRQSKPLPDFAQTDAYQVSLTLHGQLQDPGFLRFLEKIGPERAAVFTTHELLVLDTLRREQAVQGELRPVLQSLVDEGIIESLGRGRGVRYLLSRRYHQAVGKAGVYTRKKGLDRETNRQLLLKHIHDSGSEGAPLHDLHQVLSFLSETQVKYLLQGLKAEGKVQMRGYGRGSRWHGVELENLQ
ncbi:MAG: ATP-binding protein [Phycisphaerae bacterium]